MAQRKRLTTKDKILAAATKLFAAKGLEGARVDEIAQRSGANKNMIYHYFGSKEGLFEAVLERMYETIRSRQRDFQVLEMAPEEGMRALAEFTFDIFVEIPEFISLMNSENLCKAKHIKGSPSIVPMYNPLLATINELLRRGQEAGVFRENIDAVDLYISISGLGAYYISNRYSFSALFGTELMAPERLRQRHQHVIEMILRYVRA